MNERERLIPVIDKFLEEQVPLPLWAAEMLADAILEAQAEERAAVAGLVSLLTTWPQPEYVNLHEECAHKSCINVRLILECREAARKGQAPHG